MGLSFSTLPWTFTQFDLHPHREYTEGCVSAEQRRLASWLRRAVRVVQRYGIVPEFLMNQLSCFAALPEFEEFKSGLEAVFDVFLAETADTAETRSCIKSLLLRHLRARLGPLSEAMKQEDEALSRLQALVSVPTGPALDQILCYDGSMERKLQRAIAVPVFLKGKVHVESGAGSEQGEIRNKAKN